MRTKWLIATISALVAITLTSGCTVIDTVSPKKPAGEPKTTAVVVLMDLSGSTKKDAVRADYLAGLQRVTDRMYYGDTISAWSIDQDSIKNSTPLNDDAPWPLLKEEAESTYQEGQLERKFREENPLPELRKKMLSDVEPHMADKTKGSDLLGAMQIASRKLGLSKASERWLIVFSDMLISDGEHTMYKKFEPDRLLEEIRDGEGIADLQGVKVIVVGADGKDKKQYRLVQEFWMSYLEEAGAEMPPAHYGTKLPTELLTQINGDIDFEKTSPRRIE